MMASRVPFGHNGCRQTVAFKYDLERPPVGVLLACVLQAFRSTIQATALANQKRSELHPAKVGPVSIDRHSSWLVFVVASAWACTSLAQTAGAPLSPPSPDPSGILQARFISFVLPSNSFGTTAVRVQMVALNHVSPPYSEPLPAFTAFEGLQVWVGPPQEYVESAGSGIRFRAAKTQCTPYYQDWNTVGLLHVTGSAIVSSSTYRLDHVPAYCQGREDDADCAPGGINVSSQLEIKTGRWADVVTPFNPSPGQPDFADISALVDKFKNAPGAPIKARALLIGKDGFGNIDIAEQFSFAHIAGCVDAFRGMHYPHKMGRCAVGGSPCTTASDCSGAGGAGPCTLYCP